MKLILLSLVATIAAAVSLAAVAQSATTAQTVRVTEVDYAIRLSAKPKPGVVKFVVRNAGDDGHDFWVKGGGKTFVLDLFEGDDVGFCGPYRRLRTWRGLGCGQ